MLFEKKFEEYYKETAASLNVIYENQEGMDLIQTCEMVSSIIKSQIEDDIREEKRMFERRIAPIMEMIKNKQIPIYDVRNTIIALISGSPYGSAIKREVLEKHIGSLTKNLRKNIQKLFNQQ